MEVTNSNKSARRRVSATQAQQKYKQFIKIVERRVAHKPADFRAYITARLDQLQDSLEEVGVL